MEANYGHFAVFYLFHAWYWLFSSMSDFVASKSAPPRAQSSSEDRNILIKPADKGSCVVVWDREHYIAEADRQFKDNETYENSSFEDVDLVKLIEKSNSIFESLRKRKLITEEELKYFTYKYKKATNFGKMYLYISV